MGVAIHYTNYTLAKHFFWAGYCISGFMAKDSCLQLSNQALPSVERARKKKNVWDISRVSLGFRGTKQQNATSAMRERRHLQLHPQNSPLLPTNIPFLERSIGLFNLHGWWTPHVFVKAPLLLVLLVPHSSCFSHAVWWWWNPMTTFSERRFRCCFFMLGISGS